MLDKNPITRITIEDVLEYPLIKSYVDKIIGFNAFVNREVKGHTSGNTLTF